MINRTTIDEKVETVIRNLRFASHAAKKRGGILNVCYSGGKDSDVILTLTKMANRPYRVSHSLTTLDAPETIKHISEVKKETEKDLNCIEFELTKPEKTFTELIEETGFPPTRSHRYCCSKLKEGNNGEKGDILVLGVRAEESSKRKNRKLFQIHTKDKETGDKFTNCDLPKFNRLYTEKFHETKYKIVINAIVNWTLDDIIQFVEKYDIEMNPVYEKQGGLHTRCGCLFCPLASQNSRIRDINNYPNQYRRVLKSLQKIARKIGHGEENDYEYAAFYFLASSNKSLNEYINTLEQWEREKWHNALRSQLNLHKQRGASITEIVDYFEDFPFLQNEISWERTHDPRVRICAVCKKRGKVTPEIKALNLKLYGRGLPRSQFRCIDCLAQEIGVATEQLREKIESFKAQGCELF